MALLLMLPNRLCLCLQGAVLSSLTCLQLHKRAEKIAAMLMERGHLQDGEHVALVYPPGALLARTVLSHPNPFPAVASD